ncbi:MAG TPA: hypothetical protein VN931_05255 [Fibrobacteria bacterium]|nr:hypothetical protein [Fibrobacteria bacterium]
MRNLLLWTVAPTLVLLGCAGSAPRDGSEGSEILDRAARRVAERYRDQCFEPVAKREVPDDMCQFDLFDKAEREWGTGFGVTELKVSANKMLGIEIEKELYKLLVYDQASQRYVASSTRTRYEIIAALKDKYRIR